MSAPDTGWAPSERSQRFSGISFAPIPSLELDPQLTPSQPLSQNETDGPLSRHSASSQSLIEQDSNAPSAETPVPLQSKGRQLWLTTTLLVITLPYSGFLFYYLIQVLTENDPKIGRLLLLLDPSTTLLLVTVLSQGLVMLHNVLMNRVLDVLRWQLALRTEGVRAPIFFVLGSSISFFGAFTMLRIGGKTTIWSFHKLLMPALFWFTNIILKARITYPEVYTTQNTFQMFSGIAPLNTTTLLQAHVVDASVICTYFAGNIANILSVPKYVAETTPLACSGSNCDSIFLPGGIEQMRLPNTSFGGTVLQGGFLNGPDAITSYRTPGYQLDFFPSTDFTFDPDLDCTLYGVSSGEGIYVCIATDAESHLVIGWSVCPSTWYDRKACINETTWTETLQQNVTVAGWKRYAQVTYDSKNFSILDADTGSWKEAVDFQVSDFRLAYDTVLNDTAASGFSAVNNSIHSNPNLYMVDSLLYQLGWVLRLYMDFFPADDKTPTDFLKSMVVIPIQFSTAAWQKINASWEQLFPQSTAYALPPDLLTTVSTVRRTARVMAVPWSVYTFIGMICIFYLYICTLFLWVMCKREKLPHISDFPELDFASKITQPDLEMRALNGNAVADADPALNSRYLQMTGLSNATSGTLIERLRNKTIRVVAKPGEKKSIVVLTSDSADDGVPLVVGEVYY